MTVVDLGGTVDWWLRAPVRPAHVTVVNLFEPGPQSHSNLVPVLGDACEAETVLSAAGLPGRYDLAFSNSLIEHVGGQAKRTDLARQVHALAPFHWVQTPYRYFPVEPHWLFPMMQFLPNRARLTIAQHWPLTPGGPAPREKALDSVLWTELLSLTEMRSYFPSSRLLHEKLGGLTKSIIAVKS
jgi:hypothetical protein